MARLVELWRKPRGFWVDVLPALLYLAVLFWFGLTPLTRLPGPDFDFIDKIWHFAAFGGLAALSARALSYIGRPALRADREAAIASAAVGALLELLQSLTAYRSADLGDFVADGLGALVAYLILARLA